MKWFQSEILVTKKTPSYLSILIEDAISGWNGGQGRVVAWWQAETSTLLSWSCLMLQLLLVLRYFHVIPFPLVVLPKTITMTSAFVKHALWIVWTVWHHYYHHHHHHHYVHQAASLPVCLECASPLTSETKYRCGLCNLPLCSEACQVHNFCQLWWCCHLWWCQVMMMLSIMERIVLKHFFLTF